MSEKLPEHVFHQFDYLFDKMDGAHFGEAEIAGILHGAKNDGIYPGADYVYRYIQCLQIRLREEKERTLHHKYKRCLDKAEMCQARYDEEDARVNGRGASWDYTSDEMKYWERWHRRWLELANQFNPNSTATKENSDG